MSTTFTQEAHLYRDIRSAILLQQRIASAVANARSLHVEADHSVVDDATESDSGSSSFEFSDTSSVEGTTEYSTDDDNSIVNDESDDVMSHPS
jgi:hypothetical protein